MTGNGHWAVSNGPQTKTFAQGPRHTAHGFLLTVDGVIALSILLIILTVITNQIFQPTVPRGAYLKQISLDTIKVLDYDGRIVSAINGNTTSVRSVLETLPVNICMQLNIENSIISSNITVAKPGCGGFGNQLQTIYRTVTVSGTRYLIRLESWFRN